MKIRNVDRNIYQSGDNGRYIVRMTRKPDVIYRGGIETLERARIIRDGIEIMHPHGHRWTRRGRIPEGERKTDNSRTETRRQAGLCPYCGDEPPRAGYKMCAGCQQAARERYHNRKVAK